MLLDSTEVVRQVLVSSIEAGIPGANSAMIEWAKVNGALVVLKELEVLMNSENGDGNG